MKEKGQSSSPERFSGTDLRREVIKRINGILAMDYQFKDDLSAARVGTVLTHLMILV